MKATSTPTNSGNVPGSHRYYVGKSRIHGLGTFAAKDFKPGQIIGVLTVAQKDDFGPIRMIRTELGRFINHQGKPNSIAVPFVRDSWVLVAIKPIKKDEEITASYCQIYDAYKQKYGNFVIPRGYIRFRKDLPEGEPPGMKLPECPHWSALTEKQ